MRGLNLHSPLLLIQYMCQGQSRYKMGNGHPTFNMESLYWVYTNPTIGFINPTIGLMLMTLPYYMETMGVDRPKHI